MDSICNSYSLLHSNSCQYPWWLQQSQLQELWHRKDYITGLYLQASHKHSQAKSLKSKVTSAHKQSHFSHSQAKSLLGWSLSSLGTSTLLLSTGTPKIFPADIHILLYPYFFVPLYSHWTRSLSFKLLIPWSPTSFICIPPNWQSFLSLLLIKPLESLFEGLRLPLHPRRCLTFCSQSSPLPPSPHWGFICIYC